MSYNQPSQLIKSLEFGDEAKSKIIAGVNKLARAVKSTLGASGKCVIFEDARGMPVITKDGVTVAESVVLYDPVENMGATLVKEAARNTVSEAGDGTTTATVLAQALLTEVYKELKEDTSIREIKDGINTGLKKINEYLDKSAVKIEGDMLRSVSSISCNNDAELGEIIAEAYETVGRDGVVLMESSETNETYIDVVDGVKIECPLTSTHFITNTEKHRAELDNPLILIVSSTIPNVRKIQVVLEHVIKQGRSLLLVASVDQQVKAALTMNKVKGNIKINIIDLPGFGPTKKDATDDLAMLTGATVINEELGDDLDQITTEYLGEAEYSVTDDKSTVITLLEETGPLVKERIEEVKVRIKAEKNGYIKKKLEERLAMLACSVGIIKVGADSKVELKEKKDRVEDAIWATKAALKEGIVPGGGVALLNASQKIPAKTIGEQVLMRAITAPFHTVLENAGIKIMAGTVDHEGWGVNCINGERVNMIKAGIIDPVLVTKSALKNAVSVVSTIISADCVISNIRADESN
jgi:chaperonin GroEL